jgi:hypothetical protein
VSARGSPGGCESGERIGRSKTPWVLIPGEARESRDGTPPLVPWQASRAASELRSSAFHAPLVGARKRIGLLEEVRHRDASVEGSPTPALAHVHMPQFRHQRCGACDSSYDCFARSSALKGSARPLSSSTDEQHRSVGRVCVSQVLCGAGFFAGPTARHGGCLGASMELRLTLARTAALAAAAACSSSGTNRRRRRPHRTAHSRTRSGWGPPPCVHDRWRQGSTLAVASSGARRSPARP